jgi:hypothetical protein
MLRRLEVEADELASFVQKKANKQWIWIAMDATSHQVIAFHVGDRSRRSAKRLWAKIPQSAPTDAAYCGANGARGHAVRRGIAGWNGGCHCVIPAHPRASDVSDSG